MPKYYTFPTIIDSLKTLNISFLNHHGYLVKNQFKSGIVNWKSGGEKTGSISISSNTLSEIPYLTLSYTYNNQRFNYDVSLIYVKSNLGKGEFCFMICPETGRNCRKLYLHNGKFQSRANIKGGMYNCQTFSEKTRNLFSAFKRENAFELFYGKYFKTRYNGKETKRFKIIKKELGNSNIFM